MEPAFRLDIGLSDIASRPAGKADTGWALVADLSEI
jgi:hypothetical protein